jgi:hypothetical protein
MTLLPDGNVSALAARVRSNVDTHHVDRER